LTYTTISTEKLVDIFTFDIPIPENQLLFNLNPDAGELYELRHAEELMNKGAK
jgi:hypothetical protein